MNIIQLKYFNAVCTYRTVSAAAEYLHISQPSLSASIKELEREFGVALFYRQHRGMTLTHEGEVLHAMAKDLLNRAEQIENVMSDLGRERRILRLGIPPMIASLFLPRIYRDFIPSCPGIQAEITEGGRGELMSMLSDDCLDMVFLPHDRAPEPWLMSQKITRLEIVCCASHSNPISRCKSLSPKELCGIPLVLFKNSFFQTEEIKKRFAMNNITPDILLQTQQLSTVLSVIREDIAVGFMFRQLIESNPNLVPIPLSVPMYVDVSLVWKKNAYMFNYMRKLKEFVNNL